MSMRTSTVTATIAAGANQKLTFTLVVPNNPNPILQYFVVADSADGTLFPVPYSVSQQLDSSGTLGSGINLVSPQDIQLWQGGAWVTSHAYYVVSGAGVSYNTSNFAYSGSTRDLSTLLASTPSAPYTTANITIAMPPPPTGTTPQARATLSTSCFYAPGVIVPASTPFTAPIASDGTGTLTLIPNSLLAPTNPAIAAGDVVWMVTVSGVTVPIRVPSGGGTLTGSVVNLIGGHVVYTPTNPTLGFAEILL